MYSCFDPSWLPCAELDSACGLLDVCADGGKDCLACDPPCDFADADGVNTWSFVEGDKPAGYICLQAVVVHFFSAEASSKGGEGITEIGGCGVKRRA